MTRQRRRDDSSKVKQEEGNQSAEISSSQPTGTEVLPALVFVHGIACGPERRAQMLSMLEAKLTARGVRGSFGRVVVAEWRSLGDFKADLFDLAKHETRRNEAVHDVSQTILRACECARGLVVIGHSMGQPLSVMALRSLRQRGAPLPVRALLTLGGPMGNSWARPYFHWMPQALWGEDPQTSIGVSKWVDVWNPDDPVCGWHTYTAFRAAHPQRFNWPGTPSILNPFAEHGAYFDGRDTFLTLARMVAGLDTASAPR